MLKKNGKLQIINFTEPFHSKRENLSNSLANKMRDDGISDAILNAR